MKIQSLTILTLFCVLLFNFNLSAQCPSIVCHNDTTIYVDNNNCGAVFNYNSPTGTDTCATVPPITFSFIPDSIQQWVVPTGVTAIRIEARGGEGGTNLSSSLPAGKGAIMTGDFAVTPGSGLKILVAGQGIRNGGGGGSFVTDLSNNPLIVAGGGAGSHNTTATTSKDGNITTAGGDGSGQGGTGGINGNGGNNNGTSSFLSGAGGGLLTDGADGWATNTGGKAFVNGGFGGGGSAAGGFGGGGTGSGNVVGGAGGGYSGGGSGGNTTAGHGGGGGSFNNGTNQNNIGGTNSGNGLVIITVLSAAIPSTQTAGLASGATFPAGTTTNTFVITDSLGNADSCSFNVTVIDTLAPTIVCPANSTVCTPTVTGLAPSISPTCPGDTISYTLSGATTGFGGNDASGTMFNPGLTTLTYTVTDASGNQASCSASITVAPTASITAFNPNTICENQASVALPSATPVGGSYSGNGVSPTDFDPATAGIGMHTVTYSYTDSAGCYNLDSTMITVLAAPTVSIATFNPDTFCSSSMNVTLPSATPAGGTYSGNGVNTTDFNPSMAGVGTHLVTYSYTDSVGCSNSDSTSVVIVTCSNVNKIEDNFTFNVYPNPSNGNFTLDLGDNTNEAFIEIYSTIGTLVYSQQVNQSKVDVSLTDITKGMYFIKVQSTKGQTVRGIVINSNN